MLASFWWKPFYNCCAQNPGFTSLWVQNNTNSMCVTSRSSEALIGCATENICVAWQQHWHMPEFLKKLSTLECIETKDRGFPSLKKMASWQDQAVCAQAWLPKFLLWTIDCINYEMGETSIPDCSYSDHDLQRILFGFLNLFKKNEWNFN